MSTVVLVVLATVSITRVSISNATVQLMQAAEQTTIAIDQARTKGMELEVVHSLENNPTKIQDHAAALGILPNNKTITMPARDSFSIETIREMSTAAAETRAAELQVLKDIAEQTASQPATQPAAQATEEKPAVEDGTLEPSTANKPLQSNETKTE